MDFCRKVNEMKIYFKGIFLDGGLGQWGIWDMCAGDWLVLGGCTKKIFSRKERPMIVFWIPYVCVQSFSGF